MRLQVLVLAKDYKDGFTRIGEHASFHEIENPFGKTGRQISFKTEAAFARLFAQASDMGYVALPFRRSPSSLVPLLQPYNLLR